MESHDELKTTSIYKDAFDYAIGLLNKDSEVSHFRFALIRDSYKTELKYSKHGTDTRLTIINLLAYEDAEKEFKLMRLIQGK